MINSLLGQTSFARKVENQLLPGEQILCTATPCPTRPTFGTHISLGMVFLFFCLATAPWFHPVTKLVSLLIAVFLYLVPCLTARTKPPFVAVCTDKRVLFCDSEGQVLRVRSSEEVTIERKGQDQLTIAEKNDDEFTTKWLLTADSEELTLFEMRCQIARLS